MRALQEVSQRANGVPIGTFLVQWKHTFGKLLHKMKYAMEVRLRHGETRRNGTSVRSLYILGMMVIPSRSSPGLLLACWSLMEAPFSVKLAENPSQTVRYSGKMVSWTAPGC